MEEANTIINEERPTDFKPRFLSSPIEYQYVSDHVVLPRQLSRQLISPILNQCSLSSIKKKNPSPTLPFGRNTITRQIMSWSTLKLWIMKNSQVRLYCIKAYVFSLESTPDYNPADFSVPGKDSSSAFFDSRF